MTILTFNIHFKVTTSLIKFQSYQYYATTNKWTVTKIFKSNIALFTF